MNAARIERAALVAAGLVIIVLTAGAFWLSYAHLAEVAGAHGLGGATIRQWAWPATLDAFIVGGELLMLRAGLRGVTDAWAIGLTVAGSVGSIGLNVAGVGTGAGALDYVVAAVPPTAALLAFGALMRQVHGLVVDVPDVAVPTGDTAPAEVSPLVSPPSGPAPAKTAKPLVICGGHLDIPTVPPRKKLGTAEARTAIEQAWRDGLSVRDAAKVSTRGRSQVQRVYARLDETRPMAGQTTIEGVAA